MSLPFASRNRLGPSSALSLRRALVGAEAVVTLVEP